MGWVLELFTDIGEMDCEQIKTPASNQHRSKTTLAKRILVFWEMVLIQKLGL